MRAWDLSWPPWIVCLLIRSHPKLGSDVDLYRARRTSMFQAAAALFTRTNVSQNYSILAPGTDVPSVNGLPAAPVLPPFKAGPWFIQPAQHKLNGKRVSVWSFEKRSAEMDKLGAQSRERVIEVLKAEVNKIHETVYKPIWMVLMILYADMKL